MSNENIINNDIKTAEKGTGTTTKNRVIKAQELSAQSIVNLIYSIETIIFQDSEDVLLRVKLPFADIMVDYMKLPYFFPDKFEEVIDFGEFFDNYINGEYTNYINTMNKTKTSQIVDNAVEQRKNILINRLGSPALKTLTTLNTLLQELQDYVEKRKDIDNADVQKFMEDFSKFSEKTNPESVVAVMLQQVIEEAKKKQNESKKDKQDK